MPREVPEFTPSLREDELPARVRAALGALNRILYVWPGRARVTSAEPDVGADRLDFAPGGVALPHRHRGGGIRC